MNEDIIIVYLHMLLFILNCTQFVLMKINMPSIPVFSAYFIKPNV